MLEQVEMEGEEVKINKDIDPPFIFFLSSSPV